MEHAFTIKPLILCFFLTFHDFPRKIPLISRGPIQTDSRLEKRYKDTDGPRQKTGEI